MPSAVVPRNGDLGHATSPQVPSTRLSVCKKNPSDLPSSYPMPSQEDLKFMDEMSKRDTGASFFEKNKRGD